MNRVFKDSYPVFHCYPVYALLVKLEGQFLHTKLNFVKKKKNSP